MSWSSDALLVKAKRTVSRAMVSDRGDRDFGFWLSLSAELLVRAAVSRINPLLLAEPEKGGTTNVLYALGREIGKGKPRSRGTVELIALATALIPEFGEWERAFRTLAELRNEELHTGADPFLVMPDNLLVEFYSGAKVLMASMGEELSDLLGVEEGLAAEQMIAADAGAVRARVNRAIALARDAFLRLTGDEQLKRRDESSRRAHLMSYLGGHKAVCPSCGATASIRGRSVASKPPVLENDRIVLRETMVPSHLACGSCLLELDSHAELLAAGLGGQYTRTTRNDPLDFYGGVVEEGEEYDNE